MFWNSSAVYFFLLQPLSGIWWFCGGRQFFFFSYFLPFFLSFSLFSFLSVFLVHKLCIVEKSHTWLESMDSIFFQQCWGLWLTVFSWHHMLTLPLLISIFAGYFCFLPWKALWLLVLCDMSLFIFLWSPTVSIIMCFIWTAQFLVVQWTFIYLTFSQLIPISNYQPLQTFIAITGEWFRIICM